MSIRTSILAVFLFAAVQLHGQAAPTAGQSEDAAPRVELQANYNYLYANVVNANNFSLYYGANAQAVVNLNKNWGLMADFSGSTANNITASTLPGPTMDLNLYNFHFGGRYSMRNHTRLTPYLQGLVGASKISSSYSPYSNYPVVFGSTAGVGVTLRATRHFGFTLAEADWLYSKGTNFVKDSQNDLRLAAGLYFRFGSVGHAAPVVVAPVAAVAPPPPPVIQCAVTPATVNVGEQVHLRALNLVPGVDYRWLSTGGVVASNRENAEVDTTDLDGGTYVATIGHLVNGDTRVDDCTGTFIVRPHPRREVAPPPPPPPPPPPAPPRDESAEHRAQLRSQLNAVHKTTESARGLNLTLNSVLFDTGKYDLTPTAQSVLSRVATILDQYPGVEIHIEGHTDSVGSDASNQRLSENRAKAVRDFLVKKGFPIINITAAGYGKRFPVTSNETATGRAQNRRVDILIAGDVIGLRYREP
ncbi:MAG: OmpA family protein [Acidobacteriaceae bacterium]|nr:OmpA family protein [Acidobacteriaceae bacterium]